MSLTYRNDWIYFGRYLDQIKIAAEWRKIAYKTMWRQDKGGWLENERVGLDQILERNIRPCSLLVSQTPETYLNRALRPTFPPGLLKRGKAKGQGKSTMFALEKHFY